MVKGGNTRGLSTIVATLLIIMLALVAVGIIWVVVRGIIQGNSDQISLGKFTLDLEIVQVQKIDDSTLNITVKRNKGEGEFVALSFIVDDGTLTEVIRKNVSMLEMQEGNFSLNFVLLNASKVKKISVTPIYINQSGKEVLGDVKDEYTIRNVCSNYCPPLSQCGFSNCGAACGRGCSSGYLCLNYKCVKEKTSSGGSGGGGSSGGSGGTSSDDEDITPTCNDTCSSLVYQCGIQNICGNTIVCGNCLNGYVCVSGLCVQNATCTPTTCVALSRTCGTASNGCGGTLSCGSCSTGYNCQYNGTCIKEDINLKYIVQNNVGYADIIISSNAPNMTKLAAKYFQMYIYNMTNVMLPISNTINVNKQYHIYIGRSSYTDALGINSNGCRDGGFKMVSGNNYLVLLGEDGIFNVPGYNGVPGPRTNTQWDALTGDTWTNDYMDYYPGAYNAIHGIWATDKRGSMNAVYEFLYNQGIRWYSPGWYEHPGIGIIIPEKEDIGFSNVNSLINPDFSMRDFGLYLKSFGHIGPYHYDGQSEEELQWQLSLGGNNYYEFLIGSLGGVGHGIRAVIARPETEAEHPEYYAVLDGVRMNGGDPVPDLCSQGLLEENVRYVKAMFDIYNVSMVSVMPTDGFSRASDECKYMESGPLYNDGFLSDYVWEYINNLSWKIYEDPKYRNKKIFAGAYTTYQLPPQHLSKPFAPNLAVVITKWRGDNTDEGTKEHFEDLTNQWYNLLPSHQVYTYDYYLYNNPGRTTQGVPVYFPHIIDEDIKFLKSIGLKGETSEISTVSDWPPYEFTTGTWNLRWDSFAANSLNVYITARLYWDADQDVDALLNEYYDLYYGPNAKDQMKTFIEYSENHFAESLVDPTVIRTMRTMLTNARAAAGNNIYGERIDLLIGLMNSNYEGDEVFINSCRVLNSPTSTYKLTSDVSSTGTCFTFEHVGITLDCQGHKITYSTNGQNNQHGIYADLGVNAITIKNCNIQQGTALGNYNEGIRISRSIGATIENTNINTTTTGIWFIDMTNVNVTRTNITALSSEALSTQSVVGATFTNNVLFSNAGYGIYMYNTNDSIVIGNNASSNTGHGITVMKSMRNTITDNRFTSTASTGLWEYQSSGNTYLRNIILP